MAALRVSPVKSSDQHQAGLGRKIATPKVLSAFAAGALIVALGIAALLWIRWPFRESAIIEQLEKAGSGKVQIQKFHQTYFPHPGCVAEGVAYRLGPNAAPFATLNSLRIQGNIWGLLGRHIRLIRADGIHVFVPHATAKDKFTGFNSGATKVDEIMVHDAVLEVPNKQEGAAPAQFKIYEAILSPINSDQPIHFSAKLSIPQPPGDVGGSGTFGPWSGLQTPVKGTYDFANANLGKLEGIAGILASQGEFSGTLGHIDVSGKVSVPNFEVKSTEHPIALDSDFTAYVDGSNGDTFLNHVSTQSLKTKVESQGKIVGVEGHTGKTAFIDLESRRGRIEDILRLFTKSARPPMAGEISFKGKAILPSGPLRFLKKVEMLGDFGISDSNFTHPETQKKVDELSQSARTETREKEKEKKGKQEEGEPAPPVVSELKGHVAMKNGTATFSNLSFYIPGAHAQMHGTYDLISEKIDLHGTLKMDSDLSDTAHGAKALMLKVLDPFFKKKHGNGADVPVKVTGTYRNPSFGMDVGGAGKRVVGGKKN